MLELHTCVLTFSLSYFCGRNRQERVFAYVQKWLCAYEYIFGCFVSFHMHARSGVPVLVDSVFAYHTLSVYACIQLRL